MSAKSIFLVIDINFMYNKHAPKQVGDRHGFLIEKSIYMGKNRDYVFLR